MIIVSTVPTAQGYEIIWTFRSLFRSYRSSIIFCYLQTIPARFWDHVV